VAEEGRWMGEGGGVAGGGGAAPSGPEITLSLINIVDAVGSFRTATTRLRASLPRATATGAWAYFYAGVIIHCALYGMLMVKLVVI